MSLFFTFIIRVMFDDSHKTTFRDNSSEKLTRDVDVFYEKYDHEKPPVPTWTHTATETVTMTETLTKMAFGFDYYKQSDDKGQIRMRLSVPADEDGVGGVAFDATAALTIIYVPPSILHAPDVGETESKRFAFISSAPLREIDVVFSYKGTTWPPEGLPDDKTKVVITRSSGDVEHEDYDYEPLTKYDAPFYVPKVVAPSCTPSQTMTVSMTPTPTVTMTPTPTATMTPTATVTMTHPSPTPSMTETYSPTVTSTVTMTHPSPTPSMTETYSPTVTATVTHPSPTPSMTETYSPTVTHPTPTPTTTKTDTPAITPSMSHTHTVTPSAAMTHTMTTTNTISSTPTLTVTSTSTVSSTPTPTVTSTSTVSPTPTPTVTSTSTVSSTPTPTVTSTSTSTMTETETITVTHTGTETATITETVSPSVTITEESSVDAHLYFEASDPDGSDVITIAVYFNSWYGTTDDDIYSANGAPVGGGIGTNEDNSGIYSMTFEFNNFEPTSATSEYGSTHAISSTRTRVLFINKSVLTFNHFPPSRSSSHVLVATITGKKSGIVSFKIGSENTHVYARNLVSGMGISDNGSIQTHGYSISFLSASGVVDTGRRFIIKNDSYNK